MYRYSSWPVGVCAPVQHRDDTAGEQWAEPPPPSRQKQSWTSLRCEVDLDMLWASFWEGTSLYALFTAWPGDRSMSTSFILRKYHKETWCFDLIAKSEMYKPSSDHPVSPRNLQVILCALLHAGWLNILLHTWLEYSTNITSNISPKKLHQSSFSFLSKRYIWKRYC